MSQNYDELIQRLRDYREENCIGATPICVEAAAAIEVLIRARSVQEPAAYMWRDGGAWELKFGDPPESSTKAHPLYLHPSPSQADAIAQLTRERDAAAKDSKRLDFLISESAWIGWSKSRQVCQLSCLDRDGDPEPFEGWGSNCYVDPREAIDAASATQTSGKNSGGEEA